MTIVSLVIWLAWWVGNSFLGRNRGRLGLGIGVFHLHFHVIPRWEGDGPLGRHGGGQMADMDELKALAEQIAAKIS